MSSAKSAHPCRCIRTNGKYSEQRPSYMSTPLMTHLPHTGCGPCALEQLSIVKSVGVDVGKVSIGHVSDILDDPRAETHKAIAKRGAWVGFDTAAIRVANIPQQVIDGIGNRRR